MAFPPKSKPGLPVAKKKVAPKAPSQFRAKAPMPSDDDGDEMPAFKKGGKVKKLACGGMAGGKRKR